MADPTDDDTDDAGSEPATGKPTLLERLLSPTAAPTRTAAPAGGPGTDGKSTKWSIDRLDGRERLYAYLAGGIAAVFAVLIYVVETNDKHLKLTKGQFSPMTTLVVGLICAVLLFVTTRIGRRALVGFVAMFTFLGFQSTGLFLSLPFLILAVWLLYRSYKVQKEATARIKAERAASGSDPRPGRPARAPRAAATSGKAAAESRSARKKGPPIPEGNKRYTPKKPTPPPIPTPKPSWRERRAAKASD
jgi:hypothetical protein